MAEARPRTETVEEPPPILGSWRRLYLVVAGNLLLLIVLFWAFSKAFQ